jgi:uncharacterized protein YjdB
MVEAAVSATRGLRGLTRIAVAVCLAIVPAACLDGPTGPLALGELRLRPTFAPGEDPAAFGLTIDSMRVVALRRSPAGAAVDTVMPFSSGATLSWLLDLAADPETFDVDVELYGGPDTLYAGSASPAVALGFADGRAANDVALAYVGPPPASPIAQIVVKPSRVTLASLGATWQFDAEARDASGVPIPGVSFAWSSSATNVATIGQGTGLATALAEGTTTITAAAGGVTGTGTLEVDLSAASSITSIVVTPASATLTAVGATQPFAAAAYDGAGDPVGGLAFTWTSSVPAVATIGASSGVATAASEGATTISAAAGSATGTASLTVDLGGGGGGGGPVASIVVSPASATLTAAGATQQYQAQAFDAGGQPMSGVTFGWSSSNTGVASIDAVAGLATAVAEGTTTISATAGGVTGTAVLTVDLGGGGGGGAKVATILVTPAAATLVSLGATQQYSAQALDSLGQPIAGVTVTWSSSLTAVATIDGAGRATAGGNGMTTVTASAGSVSGTAVLTVSQVAARMTVTPDSARLDVLGQTVQLTAAAFDANDHPVAGATFAWSSSNDLIATVDPATGLVTAVDGHSPATITATGLGPAAGLSAAVTVLIRP